MLLLQQELEVAARAEQKLEFPSALGQEVKISTRAVEQNVLKSMDSGTIQHFIFSQLSTKAAYFCNVTLPDEVWSLNRLLCHPAPGG